MVGHGPNYEESNRQRYQEQVLFDESIGQTEAGTFSQDRDFRNILPIEWAIRRCPMPAFSRPRKACFRLYTCVRAAITANDVTSTDRAFVCGRLTAVRYAQLDHELQLRDTAAASIPRRHRREPIRCYGLARVSAGPRAHPCLGKRNASVKTTSADTRAGNERQHGYSIVHDLTIILCDISAPFFSSLDNDYAQ